MKKHAKKSLLIPILILFSVVVMTACCYLIQSFSAYAEEETKLELTTVSQEDDNMLSSEEETETSTTAPDSQTEPVDVTSQDVQTSEGMQDEPTENSITAKIHFSTCENMTGIIEYNDNSSIPFGPTEELIHEFTFVGNFIDFRYPYDETSITLLIEAEDSISEMVIVDLPENKELDSTKLFLNWIDDNTVDITIKIADTYELCFDANGGIFWETGEPFEYVPEREGYFMLTPNPLQITPPTENHIFQGWFTEKIGGEKVLTLGTQVPPYGTYSTLYAHWLWVDDPNAAININFKSENPDQHFAYTIDIYGTETEGVSNSTNLYDLYTEHEIPENFFITSSNFHMFSYSNNQFGYDYFSIFWLNGSCSIRIRPVDGEHMDCVTVNGSVITGVQNIYDYGILPENDVVIKTGVNAPWTIDISSDDGSLFICEKNVLSSENGELTQVNEIVTNHYSINLDENEKAFYYYGVDYYSQYNFSNNLLGANQFNKSSGIPLIIQTKMQEVSGREIIYTFRDYLDDLDDNSELNSSIRGLRFDGKIIAPGSISYVIDWGHRNFTLITSNYGDETTVTYDANGGIFKDGSKTNTLNAIYGEALPSVENPTAVNKEFVGWFTQPEGGVQINPSNYTWQKDDVAGITLYAHWTNVGSNINNATAQTGDTTAIVFAICVAIAIIGASVLSKRKFSIR